MVDSFTSHVFKYTTGATRSSICRKKFHASPCRILLVRIDLEDAIVDGNSRGASADLHVVLCAPFEYNIIWRDTSTYRYSLGDGLGIPGKQRKCSPSPNIPSTTAPFLSSPAPLHHYTQLSTRCSLPPSNNRLQGQTWLRNSKGIYLCQLTACLLIPGADCPR